MAGNAHVGGRMAAPATLGTGAEPDQPVPYPDDDPEYDSYAARKMGWFGIIVLAIAVLAVAAAVYVLVNGGFKPKTKVSYQPAAVFGLQTGQCFNGQNGLGVTVLSCSSPHQAEVFATFLLAEQAWPGDDAVQSAAQAGCQTRISSYINPQLATSALSQEYIYPDEITWSAGIRTVICDVRSDEGLVIGSVRQP
jgi:hypothetical protein